MIIHSLWVPLQNAYTQKETFQGIFGLLSSNTEKHLMITCLHPDNATTIRSQESEGGELAILSSGGWRTCLDINHSDKSPIMGVF